MLPKTKKIPREVVNFTPPKVYYDKDDVYVAFYARDPISGKMKKKRYMLNRFRNKRERAFMASQIIANIYNKIESGWNPWVEADTLKGFQPISEVLDLYSVNLVQRRNKRLLKPKTYTDYKSRFERVKEYIFSRAIPIRYAYQIDVYWINEFLEYILYDRDDTPRTRNNYRTWLSTFCTWMKDRKYIMENPVENVPIIHEGPKERQPLEHEDLVRLGDYLKTHNKYYYLACLLQYYTLVRPIELVRVRLRDISISTQTLFISSTISKNKRDETVAINDKIIHLMADLQIFQHHNDCYLFGKEFMPSDKPADSRIFRDEWVRVREALGFPSYYKFYSLKDNGIIDLMNDKQAGVVIARDQARHTSVEVTNLYAQGRNKPVHDEAKHFKGRL